MPIAKNSVVTMEYVLTDPQGQVLDKTEGRGPLVYLHGARNIIAGLETALEGRSVGDDVKVTIDPEKAYGLRDPRMEQTLPRHQFPKNVMILVGQQLEATRPDGRKMTVRVTRITDSEVIVDANHPLAGVPLTFEVKISDIRPATPEEVAHGHVHAPGGHAH